LQEKANEIVLGINLRPDEVYTFLLKVPTISSKLRIIEEDRNGLRIRFSWVKSVESEEDYSFDVSIAYEGTLCDLRIKPANNARSEKLPNAVASIVEAMSSHGGIRIGELRDYTEAEKEPPTEEDIEKVAAYLKDHVLADLEQISSSLRMLHLTASMCLHRLIDNGVIGCAPIGTKPTKLYYYK